MIFLSGFLSAGYYWSFYDNGEVLKTEIDTAGQNLKNSEKKLQDKKIELEETVIFDDSVKRLGKEIDIFLSYIPTHLTTRNLFEDITKLTKSSGVEIMQMRNSNRTVSKNSLYDSIAVALSLEGDFSQILTFLSELTSLDKIITVNNVSIQPRGTESTKVKADMNLVGYRYLKPKEPEEEKKI